MKRMLSRRSRREIAAGIVVAIFILNLVLLSPTYPDNIVPRAFLFLSIELPVVVLLLTLPLSRFALPLRITLVLALTTFTVLKIANFITFLFFARPFNPIVDPALIPIALETMAMTSVFLVALAIAGVVVLFGALAALFVWTAHVLSAEGSRPAVVMIGAVLLMAATGMKVTPWRSYVSHDAVIFVEWQSGIVVRSIAAAAQFKRDVAADPFRGIPSERLLTRLKGNDVLVIFVEAYGRAALTAAAGAPAAQLAASEVSLRDAGYSMRSAWLISPTFGGASWLAHGTFVAGLWIEDHQRYNTLFVSEHQTLIHDFTRAGWRTAGVMPLFTRPWPEGGFFGFDMIYTGNNLGYAGPPFGYMTMPDQYALSAFHQRELALPNRRPVMAEIALNSSHLPWTPRPHFLPWEAIGDGSVFTTAREGQEADIDWLDANKMKSNYEKAITYAIKTVFSYAEKLLQQQVAGQRTGERLLEAIWAHCGVALGGASAARKHRVKR